MKLKRIILITLLLLAILTIGAVSAADNNATNEVVKIENDNEAIDTINLDEESSENTVNGEILELEGQSGETTLNSGDEFNSNDILSSSSSVKIKETASTEVWLMESSSKNAYIIDTISKYPNSNVKFHVMINSYFNNEYGGTVTLKYNGNSYTGDIFDGKATIIAKTPSKPGSYKATLSYSGYTYVFGSDGYKYNPSSSTFILKVKGQSATVNAPTVTAYYKANKYFKVSVKKNGKAVKNLKLNVKVYTGSKYKNYVIKTNNNGIAMLNTKNFKVGSHKVTIISKNSKYKFSKNSKIVIKKKIQYTSFKSPSGYEWKIKTSTWNKMKKEANNWYERMKKVGSSLPGYSNSVNVKVIRGEAAYGAIALAVKNHKGIRCQIRGLPNGLRTSNWGDE